MCFMLWPAEILDLEDGGGTPDPEWTNSTAASSTTSWRSMYGAGMPEGHTIHRIARRHRDLFAGGAVNVSSPQGRFALGAAELDGQKLEDVDAYGKHLLYRWAGPSTLHIHLGLIGSFRTHPNPPPTPSAATRLALANDDGVAYLSGPMRCALVDETAVEEIVGRLGPDPLRPGTRITEFARRLSTRSRPIGAVLLDQNVIAGIGNVYRSEVLFLCGINPAISAAALTSDEVKSLWSTSRAQLRNGLADGRIITVRPHDVGAARRVQLPEPLQRYVYKRDHQPCLRCHTPVAANKMAGRSVWWCPSCQPSA
jgi:DNA-formamidopyrimidine glycosylase